VDMCPRRVVAATMLPGIIPMSEGYRTLTDVQNSGGDLQVVDKVGVPIPDRFEHLSATIAEATPPSALREQVRERS
jgi:hypothetical protein